MRMRKVAVLIMLGVMLLNLTSCYDATEIDDSLPVLVLGVDKGISDKLRLTLQFHSMKGTTGGSGAQSGSGGGNVQGDYTYVSIDAPSFYTGINMLNTSISRKLNFKHSQIIIFSDELAKEGFLGEYAASLCRFREIRRTAHIWIVKGKAFDYIKENQPFIGTTLSKSLEEIMNNGNNTGFFPHVTLENFYEDFQSPCHQPIVTIAALSKPDSFKQDGVPWGTKYKTGGEYLAGEIPRTGQNKAELWGTALFRGDKMVGELNGDETRYLLIARGEFRQGSFTVPDPKNQESIIALRASSSKGTIVRVTFQGSKPIIHLKVQLDADIQSIQSEIQYEQPEMKSLLEETFRNDVKIGIDQLIEKCKNLNTDAFHFGDYAARNFNTIPEFESYNWNNHFKEAEVNVEVEICIRRNGTQKNGESAGGNQ